MHLSSLDSDSYQETKVAVRDGEGRFLKILDAPPSLDTVREVSREVGKPVERINVQRSTIPCRECGRDISERFGSTPEGEILCWECVSRAEEQNPDKLKTIDPTKTVLSDSALYHKSLCDYVINVATGCTHGCKFCYVPSTPNIRTRQDMLEERADVQNSQREWGSYLLYRDDLPERLARKLDRKQKWKHTERGRGVVMISSGTDCYQDRRTAQITRGCVIELAKREIPVRILTRSPAVTRDIDVFQRATELTDDGKLVRVGSSIPCLDDEQTRAIEPGAPVPTARLRALQELSDAGVPVYVSMSPTYPTMDRDDFRRLLQRFAELDPEVVFHEPINPRGQNFDMTVEAAQEAGQNELADELDKLKDKDQWVEYSLEQMRWVEELGEQIGVDVHVWPDKQLVKSLSGSSRDHWRDQIERPSPEQIPEPPLSA